MVAIVRAGLATADIDFEPEAPMSVDGSQHSSLFRDLTSGLVAGSAGLPVSRPFRRDGSDDDEPVYQRQIPTLKRYSEPLIKERPGNPAGDVWHLKSLLDEARDGAVAAARPLFPWSREQIEALWDNVANGWSIGMIVAVDTVGSSPMPWPERFGPWPTRNERGKRTWLLAGAEKVSALAWSLSEPPTALQQRQAPDETANWVGQTLVADPGLRRIRFVSGPVDLRRHMPVRLFPDTVPYLRVLNHMEITPIEREWLNRTARRLLEAHVGVHRFPTHHLEAAERMIANFRRIGALP